MGTSSNLNTMAIQATSSHISKTDPINDTYSQHQRIHKLAQAVTSLNDAFCKERQRREAADIRIASQLDGLMQFVCGQQSEFTVEKETDSSLEHSNDLQKASNDLQKASNDLQKASVDLQRASSKAKEPQSEPLEDTDGRHKPYLLGLATIPKDRNDLGNANNVEISSYVSSSASSATMFTSHEELGKSTSEYERGSLDGPFPNAAKSDSDRATQSRSRSNSLTSGLSSTATQSSCSSSLASPEDPVAESPETTQTSVARGIKLPADQQAAKPGRRRAQSSQLEDITAVSCHETESTVEVVAPKKSASTRRAVKYSQFEDDLIGKTVQSLCRNGASCSKALKEVAMQLGEKGYERSPGAIMVHWYTKLAKHYPVESGTASSGFHDDNDESKNLKKDTNAVPNRNVPDRSVRSKPSLTEHVAETVEVGTDNPMTSRSPPKETSCLDSLLAVRLGHGFTTRQGGKPASNTLRAYAGRSFYVTSIWTGASNDILDAAWSPDGTQHVIGCAAMEHPYNRPNNLLLGNIVSNELRELPGHREANFMSSTELLDPFTYHTVGNVCWKGNSIYTAGYDGTVEVWDASTGPVKWKSTMEHDRRVETMALSNTPSSLLATATDSGPDSLRLYPNSDSGHEGFHLPLPQKANGTPFSYTPMCMKFGLTAQYSNHLLAGFGSNSAFDDGSPSPRGFLGLWRIDEGKVNRIRLNPCSQQVFDVAWAQQSNIFMSGNTTGRRIGGVGATLIRIYDCGRSDVVQEAACPALDMNDVSTCPFDERIFSAACTNGKTYVFDMRNLAMPIHTLKHGPNVSGLTSELNDTGVRVVQWGNTRSEFFTGGSDGVLSLWDVRQGTADVLTEHVVSSGIELMCGKLSPDKNSFLLGDASGSLQILTRSPSRDDDHPEDIDFIFSGGQAQLTGAQEVGANEGGKGREAAEELLVSGQIVMDPLYGPGQGPNYQGPFAAWARPSDHRQETLGHVPLLPEFAGMQRFQSSNASGSGLKRKRDDIEFPRPAKKLNSTVPNGIEKQSANSSDKQVVEVEEGNIEAVTDNESPTDTEEWSTWESPNESIESSSDLEDDGYIPPHWMVNANLAKSVPD